MALQPFTIQVAQQVLDDLRERLGFPMRWKKQGGTPHHVMLGLTQL